MPCPHLLEQTHVALGLAAGEICFILWTMEVEPQQFTSTLIFCRKH